MELLIVIAVTVLITIVPVMIAAKMLNAANSGFLSSLIAVILSSVGSGFVSNFTTDEAVALLISFVISVAIFSVVLGAKYIQSACIALLALVIQYGTIVGLGVLGGIAGV